MAAMISKVFSTLGNNTGSVVPMFAKDMTSATLTSLTYYKDGTKHDGREKAIEEYGTGLVWLGGIPFVKKFLFDKFIYKKAKINPAIDAKKLFTAADENLPDSLEFAKKQANRLGAAFSEQSEIIENTIKNKDLAKKLSLGKFGVSTALTGLALIGIITLKQKSTEKVIKKQLKEKQQQSAYFRGELKKNPVYKQFNPDKKPSFCGLGNIGTFFMTNPVANTFIVDGVITGTRLKEARKGEKFEVGLREACQIAFIYGLAKPLQDSLEFVSEKVFKKPIKLDYAALNTDVIKEAIAAEKNQAGSSVLLKQAKEMFEAANQGNCKKGIFNKISNTAAAKMTEMAFNSDNKELAEIFKATGDIATFTTKEGKTQLSLLESINPKKLKNTAKNTIDLIENAAKCKNVDSYMKKLKAAKGASIILNIGISAILLGYVQPKLNLWLRQKLNNGDKTNPAIKNITNEMMQQLAFEGQDK